jgi:F0F1-type ATP synthase membrane subunit c/vacuolar-type H+-ATPase subunit K
MAPPRTESPVASIRVMRLIGVALAAGVSLFAVVVWILRQDGQTPPAGEPALLYLWIAFATSLAAASMVVWRGRVVPHLDRSATSDWRPRAGRIQSGLVITWALVEAAALFGVVVYFVAGHGLAGVGGVVLMWAAVVFTWPRADWLTTGGATG